jgi:hypothetical protein
MGNGRNTQENIAQSNVLSRSFNSQTNSLNTINELENEIVLGHVYYVDALYTFDTGDTVRFGATTPSDMDIRLYPADLMADANFVLLEIYEDVTFTGTTQLTPLNANRQFADNSGAIVYSAFDGTPSIIGKTRVGLYGTLGGTDVAGHSTGTKGEGKTFLILKRATNYLFVNTNNDGDGVTAIGKVTYIETDLTD